MEDLQGLKDFGKRVGQGRESEFLRSVCFYLHLQAGEARGFLDNESSYLNVEFEDTQFKSLGIPLIT